MDSTLKNNYKLLIEYDGTNYFGWQVQPEKITVQGVIKNCLEIFLQKNIKLTGASRTDRGVHAKGQVANFLSNTHYSLSEIQNKLNKLLPPDIRIRKIELVDKNFEARKSAKKKIYKYYIYNDNISSPFYRYYSWFIDGDIDLNILNKAANDLIGEKNFYSFTGQKATAETFERKIFEAFWEKKNNFYIFTISGNGFLKNMVRKIVGAMLAINNKKENEEFIEYLIQIKDRKKGKYMAPPQGLFLEEIFY